MVVNFNSALYLILVAQAHAVFTSTTASYLGMDSKIGSPSALLSKRVSTLYDCQVECQHTAPCSAYSYDDTSSVCALHERVDSLTGAAGWTSFKILKEIPDELLYPCASSPCQGGKVCVQYWPPARIPNSQMAALNFTLPGYVCSAHSWLLAQQDAGKTKCIFEYLTDTDFKNFDITGGQMRFYEAFALFSSNDALSLFGMFNDGVEWMYLKSASPYTLANNTKYLKDAITWVPFCT